MSRESPPQVSELAARLHISRSRLNRVFQEQVGTTVVEFLKKEQLEEAKRLLRDTKVSITKIAYRCGFVTRRNFYRVFLRDVGMTPAAYRLKSSN